MINLKYRTFTAKIINNGQYSETPAVVEAVRYEIHGPMLVDSFRPIHDHSEMADTLLSLLQTQRETFLPVDPLGTLVIDQVAFPAKHCVQSWGAKFSPLFGKFT